MASLPTGIKPNWKRITENQSPGLQSWTLAIECGFQKTVDMSYNSINVTSKSSVM